MRHCLLCFLMLFPAPWLDGRILAADPPAQLTPSIQETSPASDPFLATPNGQPSTQSSITSDAQAKPSQPSQLERVSVGPHSTEEIPRLRVPVGVKSDAGSDVPSVGAGEGNEILRQALQRLRQYSSVQSRVRQQINMFGNTLVGAGHYKQLNLGRDLLVRLDLKIQLEEQAATYQQICDGRFLWSYADCPDIENLGKFRRQLSRVDLDVVRKAIPSDSMMPPLVAANPAGGSNLGHGGLLGMLTELESLFEFSAPQAATLHDVPVWMVFGKWRPEAARRMVVDESEKVDSPNPAAAQPVASKPIRLPPQFPHQVSLSLGRSDLFPYRIEYRRQVADKAMEGIVVKTNTRETLTIEFFEVAINAKLDRREFMPRTGDLPVQDQTSAYLANRGLKQNR